VTSRCGVVAAHGRLGQGFLTALEHVAGPQDNLWAVSNEGISGEELEHQIKGLLADRSAGREAILFSDLDGGSCGQACRRLLDSGTVRAVFYGINLPLLIEFVFLQNESFETFAAAVLAKSRNALGIHR
jgi:PTS system mannose-specific IIA component